MMYFLNSCKLVKIRVRYIQRTGDLLAVLLVLVVLLQLVQGLADGLWQKITADSHVAGLGPVLQKIRRAAKLLAGLPQKV